MPVRHSKHLTRRNGDPTRWDVPCLNNTWIRTLLWNGSARLWFWPDQDLAEGIGQIGGISTSPRLLFYVTGYIINRLH